MGMLKGKSEYIKWTKGQKLTRNQALRAHCYICNGFEDSNSDCKGKKTCPLSPFFYYSNDYVSKRTVNPK